MTDAAVVRAEYETVERARRVECALQPELDAIEADRTSAALDRDGPALEISIEATDPVALRAGANSWLGLLEVAERVTAD